MNNKLHKCRQLFVQIAIITGGKTLLFLLQKGNSLLLTVFLNKYNVVLITHKVQKQSVVFNKLYLKLLMSF